MMGSADAGDGVSTPIREPAIRTDEPGALSKRFSLAPGASPSHAETE
jgi:hypothetical protein